MEIKEEMVYLTEEELNLIKRAKIASWNAPEFYLKNLMEAKNLHESLNLAHYKAVIRLYNNHKYTIIK